MNKRTLFASAALMFLLTLGTGVNQLDAGLENASGEATIDGPQVLPPV